MIKVYFYPSLDFEVNGFLAEIRFPPLVFWLLPDSASKLNWACFTGSPKMFVKLTTNWAWLVERPTGEMRLRMSGMWNLIF